MTSLRCPPSIAQRRCLGLSAKILYYLGIWYIGNEPKGFAYYWRHFFLRISCIRCISSIIIHIINLCIVWGTLHKMLEFLIFIIIYIGYLFRITPLLKHKTTIVRMYSMIESLCDPATLSKEDLKKIAEEADRFSHKLLKTNMIALNGVGYFVCLCLIVTGFVKRKILFQLWLPYDYTYTPVFELSLVTINILFVVDMFVLAFPTFLILAFMIHIIAQYKILRSKLDNIGKENVETTSNNTCLITIDEDFETTEDIIIDNCNPDVFCVENTFDELGGRTGESGQVKSLEESCFDFMKIESHELNEERYVDPVRSTEVQTMEKLLEDIDGNSQERDCIIEPLQTDCRNRIVNRKQVRNEVNLELEMQIKDCAIHHQNILSFTEDIREVFREYLSFELLAMVMVGFVLIYVTTLAPEMDVKVVAIILVMITAYIEFFFLCWFGNKLTDESEKLREAVYGCEWYGASESFKRSIRIMISRTNKPEVLKAGGLPLSVKSFRFICRTSYYIHNVMVKVFHGVKIN